ncbi:MAG: SDR family NAD(P)-dependent oxidoreductase, partial [Candidatus Hydrogenedentota bacterium]
MDLGLRHKTALVCGASRGLGRAVAERLLAEGASVATVSRNPPAAALAGAIPFQADLATAQGCAFAFTSAVKALGRVDCVLLNAGGPPAGSSLAMTDEQWLLSFQQNFLSAVRLCRLVVPEMTERRYGRIVAITSVSALEPLDNLALSNAFRPAVHGYLKTLSREVADSGITVNSVAPGYTDTERVRELIPSDRIPAFVEKLAMKRMVTPA